MILFSGFYLVEIKHEECYNVMWDNVFYKFNEVEKQKFSDLMKVKDQNWIML